ncbi:unnamed protein product [Bursaphelenchus okinawaensis]|uniref:Costars domain-containing protein n=1 Tax=Bursaphelenchus okinawaensis TaxID=465554 RepID=A0A811KFL0_9BILA|nr:unnamed protein product [Bursaphelenchus okinawaensis]CAG9102090.1 unnamed protein product [Bursaphelenchus okinawaensis]
MSVRNTISKFNTISTETDNKLKKNPFSNTYEQQQFDTSASDYGRPTKGSLTEKRGIKAGNYILTQVLQLCEFIIKYGSGPPEAREIKFGPLFKLYEFYSDKVVGLLIRARKYKLLTFDGEMLYQRQDDHKAIVMLMSREQIQQNVEFSGDPAAMISLKQ